jgi:thiamine pyrophosphokinase
MARYEECNGEESPRSNFVNNYDDEDLVCVDSGCNRLILKYLTGIENYEVLLTAF